MNKKMIGLFIQVLIIFSSFNVLGVNNYKHDVHVIFYNPIPEDEEDQFQKFDDDILYNISDIQILAQSFKPQKKYLTRVELKIFQGIYSSNTDIIVSIRDELDGRDITSIKVKSEDIKTSDNFSSYWHEFDFSDISVDVGSQYYIVARIAYNDLFYGYSWATCNNIDNIDRYSNGSMWLNILEGDNEWMESTVDSCFITYGYDDNTSISDLECTGILLWEDVTPGEILKGNFFVQNIGHTNSKLDWEIYEFPDWGEWTFDQIEGYDLCGGNETNIKVTIVAPNDEESYFSGLIKIINKNNSDDRDVVKITVTTSKIKKFNSYIFKSFLIPYFLKNIQL